MDKHFLTKHVAQSADLSLQRTTHVLKALGAALSAQLVEHGHIHLDNIGDITLSTNRRHEREIIFTPIGYERPLSNDNLHPKTVQKQQGNPSMSKVKNSKVAHLHVRKNSRTIDISDNPAASFDNGCPCCKNTELHAYEGIFGYSAVICKHCGAYCDCNGNHNADSWSKTLVGVGIFPLEAHQATLSA